MSNNQSTNKPQQHESVVSLTSLKREETQPETDIILNAFEQEPIPELDSEQRIDRGWQAIRAGLAQGQASNHSVSGFSDHRKTFWAMAASIIIGFGVWQLGPWPGDSTPPTPGSDNNTQYTSAELESLNTMAEVVALMDLSLQLEEEWQQIRQRPRAVSGAEIERQQQLTGLIASVDAHLTSTPGDTSRERQLWRQRVVLMNELVAGGVQAKPAVWTL